VTATTTPTNLIAGEESGGRWLVQNLGAAAVYVARSEADCTTTAGLKLGAGEAISFDSPMRSYNGGTGLWVRTASGTADVRTLRVG
jgi:hypothetical protein